MPDLPGAGVPFFLIQKGQPHEFCDAFNLERSDMRVYPAKSIAFLILSFVCNSANLRPQTASYDILIPHMAVGGGYRSIIHINDPVGLSSRDVEVSFFDDSGSPLAVRIDGGAPVASSRLTLAHFGEKSLTLTDDATSTRTGWVRIACDRGAKLGASLRFLRSTGGTSWSDAVGIVPSGVQRVWYVAVDRSTSDQYTGVAAANPNNYSVEVEFNLYQGPNRVPGTTAVRKALPPLGHLAIFTHELFPVNFSGLATLEVYGVQGSLAATALHADALQYSSLPAQPAVEAWDITVTDDSGGAVERGTWCWRYNESTGFHGVASIDSRRVDLRGSFEGSRFELARFTGSGDTPGADLLVYRGTLGTQGDRTVIRGKRLEIGSDGAVLRATNFTATRLP